MVSMLASTTPAQILSTIFGYEKFKPLQREVIENVLMRRDSLAIMPTGGGKSLCYQIPALLFPGLTVVVSPLIALMKDQVEQLEALGIPALFLNSSLSFEEYQANMARVRSGEVKLLYVAPETLLTPRLLGLLEQARVDCLTIDEAHCISEWGHDFRPEYRQLVTIRENFPEAVCLALTATATERVREDIRANLRFQTANEFIASFNRENLFIAVTPKTDPAAQLIEFLHRFPDQSGIVYCFSRKQVDNLAAFLTSKGYSARPYHAGLEDKERKQNQELFIRDDIQIIVATIAFGMGINKPNVRFVVHYDLPKSIEGYYQEIGRSGRDGLPADCLLLYSYADVMKQMYFIDQKSGSERQVAIQHLSALTRYAEGGVCRRIPLLAYFGEDYPPSGCGMCDNCRKETGQQVDITIPAQKFLSCVARTGQRFAATHITHVLTGAEDEKILRYNHQTLSTYGIGKELTRKQWLHMARQLVEMGLLEQSNDMFRVLRLTSRGSEVLKTREPILGILESARLEKPGQPGELEYDSALYHELRQTRKELADEAHVPPYVIFSDRTLVEMAAYYPMTPARMLKIFGVGQVKFERYGDIFLRQIQDYCEPRHLKEKNKPSSRPEAPLTQQVTKPRHVVVGEAYNAGQTIQALMDQYQVQRGTILEHLAKYALLGNTLRPGDDFSGMVNLPEHLKAEIVQAFADLGADFLKPVFDRMNGEVNYDDLKLLRLLFLSKRN
jgi:ATP-dependent DNA helicase RecQ